MLPRFFEGYIPEVQIPNAFCDQFRSATSLGADIFRHILVPMLRPLDIKMLLIAFGCKVTWAPYYNLPSTIGEIRKERSYKATYEYDYTVPVNGKITYSDDLAVVLDTADYCAALAYGYMGVAKVLAGRYFEWCGDDDEPLLAFTYMGLVAAASRDMVVSEYAMSLCKRAGEEEINSRWEHYLAAITSGNKDIHKYFQEVQYLDVLYDMAFAVGWGGIREYVEDLIEIARVGDDYGDTSSVLNEIAIGSMVGGHKWIFDLVLDSTNCDAELSGFAAAYGRWDVLNQLYISGRLCIHALVDGSIACDRLDVLQWGRSRGLNNISCFHLYLAVLRRRDGIVEWFLEWVTPDISIWEKIGESGRTDHLEKFHARGFVPPVKVCEMAAKHGNVDIVRWWVTAGMDCGRAALECIEGYGTTEIMDMLLHTGASMEGVRKATPRSKTYDYLGARDDAIERKKAMQEWVRANNIA